MPSNVLVNSNFPSVLYKVQKISLHIRSNLQFSSTQYNVVTLVVVRSGSQRRDPGSDLGHGKYFSFYYENNCTSSVKKWQRVTALISK